MGRGLLRGASRKRHELGTKVSRERSKGTIRSLGPGTPQQTGRGRFFGQGRCLLVVSKKRRLASLALSKRVGPDLFAYALIAPEAGAAFARTIPYRRHRYPRAARIDI
jgi:hypothetical protein